MAVLFIDKYSVKLFEFIIFYWTSSVKVNFIHFHKLSLHQLLVNNSGKLLALQRWLFFSMNSSQNYKAKSHSVRTLHFSKVVSMKLKFSKSQVTPSCFLSFLGCQALVTSPFPHGLTGAVFSSSATYSPAAFWALMQVRGKIPLWQTI